MSLPPDPPDYDHPIGHSIFSEDIRHEYDGKSSLIGVIPGKIIVPQFPAVVPKFGISVNYRQPPSFPRGPVTIRVLWEPEETSERVILVETTLDLNQVEGEERAGDWLAASAQMVISPLQLASPGTLRVRAYREGSPTLRMGGIAFERGSLPTPGTPPITIHPLLPTQPALIKG